MRTSAGLLAAVLLLAGGASCASAETATGRLVVAESGGAHQPPSAPTAEEKKLTPEERMNRRFPQSIKVGDLIGLAVLLQFNRFAIMTGIASLVIVAVYPFMKRITWWPQVVLGLAFSWGALMGFAAEFARIDAVALALYAGSIAWVIGYDTIYAHQDREDDALIGIKSTALLFGPRTKPILAIFYGWSNGVMTIVRGTVPAELFGHRGYGALLGRLARPQFVLKASAPVALTLVAPLGFDITTVAVVERLDPARTIGIDMLVDDAQTKRRVLATNPATRADMRDAAHALFARDGKAVSVIRDSAGFVTQRVVAHIANIASDICQQGICTPGDLEAAVTLGLGYPIGPLAMGNLYGPTNVLEVLFNMQTVYGDPRYRPSPWLRRRGAIGLSLLHEEE